MQKTVCDSSKKGVIQAPDYVGWDTEIDAGFKARSPVVNHVVFIASGCSLLTDQLGHDPNDDSIVRPSFASVMREWKTGVNKFGKRLRIEFDHSSALSAVYQTLQPWIKHRKGVVEPSVLDIRSLLSEYAVICNVDKPKADIAIVCPKIWQREFLRVTLKESVSKRPLI